VERYKAIVDKWLGLGGDNLHTDAKHKQQNEEIEVCFYLMFSA